jgi:uncharacterized membrane protein YsdA (DUF1294 family)
MSLLTLVAATSFVCINPTHHDGDEIRCANRGGSTKLYSIDAPRLKGECRPGRACVPGDPIVARDYLADLTKGKQVTCVALDPARTGNRELRCAAGRVDLSCSMVAAGFAFERENPLNCESYEVPRPAAKTGAKSRPARSRLSFDTLPSEWPWYLGAWLLVANILTYMAFDADKKRSRRGLNRIADTHLLALVLVGGGLGALIAQQRLDHMRTEQPFASQFAVLLGLQFGTVVGIVGMLMWPASAI